MVILFKYNQQNTGYGYRTEIRVGSRHGQRGGKELSGVNQFTVHDLTKYLIKLVSTPTTTAKTEFTPSTYGIPYTSRPRLCAHLTHPYGEVTANNTDPSRTLRGVLHLRGIQPILFHHRYLSPEPRAPSERCRRPPRYPPRTTS